MAKPSPSHAGNKKLVAIGGAIRRARRAQGISQEQLALAADLDRSYVGGVERGEHNMTVITLCRISDALGVEVADLLSKQN